MSSTNRPDYHAASTRLTDEFATAGRLELALRLAALGVTGGAQTAGVLMREARAALRAAGDAARPRHHAAFAALEEAFSARYGDVGVGAGLGRPRPKPQGGGQQ